MVPPPEPATDTVLVIRPDAPEGERDREVFRLEPDHRVEIGAYYRRWVEEPFADDRSPGRDRLKSPAEETYPMWAGAP